MKSTTNTFLSAGLFTAFQDPKLLFTLDEDNLTMFSREKHVREREKRTETGNIWG
jgi:hypothetical protein